MTGAERIYAMTDLERYAEEARYWKTTLAAEGERCLHPKLQAIFDRAAEEAGDLQRSFEDRAKVQREVCP